VGRHLAVVLALALGVACGGSANFSSNSAASSDAGVPDGLVSISLSQTDVHIPVGTMTAFAVTGTMRNGSRIDLTQQANARSANESVATVEHGQGSQILIHAVATGTTTITVNVGSLQQTVAVTVTPR
jgi:hypothetical protein